MTGSLKAKSNGETVVKTSTKAAVPQAKPLPGLVRVGEAAEFMSISRASLYSLISRGEIPIRRIGSSIRIPREWLERQAAVED